MPVRSASLRARIVHGQRSAILRRRHFWRWLILAYGLLLGSSAFVRHTTRRPTPTDQAIVMVSARPAQTSQPPQIQLAYRDLYPPEASIGAPVVLLHGSPGVGADFRSVAPALALRSRVIIPDLPGFGSSSHDLPDYSFRTHAAYVFDLLDHLAIQRAHIVGFSMGGGVALSMIDLAPKRIQSLTMLSAIGVQEMELLGDYRLNHAVHGAQLAGLWLMREAIPHFGWLDHAMLNVPYARNFYDSDQRPLRTILQHVTTPALIVHGRRDRLVPFAAALEHHRLMPQSQLRELDGDHFMVFTRGRALATVLGEFFAKVERGDAPMRAQAPLDRLAAARQPFDAKTLPRMEGIAALTAAALLATATLVSEDLTCVGAGILVATGRIGFATAAGGCYVGIFIGDLLLFLTGRVAGRRLLHIPPFCWFITAAAVTRSSAWLARRGPAVVLLSRFIPGTRFTTYVTAGLLHTDLWRFARYFALAGALWSLLLVGSAAAVGGSFMASAMLTRYGGVTRVVLAILIATIVLRLAIVVSSARGRRLLVSSWRRVTRWEFWPPWVFYPPVLAYILLLAVRHRSLTVFTAANPAIVAGGFVGESKFAILRDLGAAGDRISTSALIESRLDVEARVSLARHFMAVHHLEFPVVLKPDQGQRGSGVVVIRSSGALRDYLARASGDVVVQEYAPGAEFGIFYYRHPSEPSGHVFSVTEKRLTTVVGDGRRTIERLILDDDRAVCMARYFLRQHGARLDEVPAPGELVQLVDVGTHCRGALFLDGSWVMTPALEAAFDDIARRFDGFYFGSFDVRTPSLADFQQGHNFKVVELNGVTSEATHIYDPAYSLFTAYRTLAAQWRLAFEIGSENRRRGARPISTTALLQLIRAYRRTAARHVEQVPCPRVATGRNHGGSVAVSETDAVV